MLKIHLLTRQISTGQMSTGTNVHKLFLDMDNFGKHLD